MRFTRFMLCITAVIAPGLAGAAEYPSRPIRFVVGFSAGGPADILARIIGQKLAESWRQQVVVDNRPGAGGNIAGEIVARASPDGYTLYMANIGHAVNPSLYGSLPFDPVGNFVPIVLAASQPLLLSTHPGVPANSVQDLIALAKREPGKLNFGSAGNGSGGHLAGEYLKLLTGIDLVHIPYKGSPPAMQDLLAGQIKLMFDGLPSSLPLARSGKTRALGVSSRERSPVAPDIPAIAETVPQYEAYGWNGVLAPAGVPPRLVEIINVEVNRILQLPDVGAQLEKLGFQSKGGSSREFASFLGQEMKKWSEVIKRAGIRAG
jgi:tripartite-type tricarboxylate transporter receptor subunit TctC